MASTPLRATSSTVYKVRTNAHLVVSRRGFSRVRCAAALAAKILKSFRTSPNRREADLLDRRARPHKKSEFKVSSNSDSIGLTPQVQRRFAAHRAMRPRSFWPPLSSLLLLIPILLFAVHGEFSFQNLGTAGGNFESSDSLSRTVIFPAISYSIVLWPIFRNARRIASVTRHMKAITFLGILAILSALWSQDPARSLTFGTCYLFDTLFAFYLAARYDVEEIMDLVKMSGVAVALLGLVLIFTLPQYAVSSALRDAGAWQGIFPDRTSAAKCLTFLLSPALILKRRDLTWSRLAYICLLTLMIVKAHAVTAIVAVITLVIAMGALRIIGRVEDRAASLFIGLMGLVAVLLAVAGPFLAAALLGVLNRDATLTGRTDVWAAVIRSILKRPFLGYGYYAFWLGTNGESANVIDATGWMFGYAHNCILEVFLQLGLVGVAVLVFTFIQAVRNAWICARARMSANVEWYVGVLILIVLYNIDEATLMWPNELLSILYVVVCCGLAKEARAVNEHDMLHLRQG